MHTGGASLGHALSGDVLGRDFHHAHALPRELDFLFPPVSYTHLDVYKRQDVGIGPDSRVRPDDAFFNLAADVYKRQST